MGYYFDIHKFNRAHTENYNYRVFSFVRWSNDEKLLIISNFDADKNYAFDLKIPESLISDWGLADGDYHLRDQLYGEVLSILKIENNLGIVKIKLNPLDSLILKMDK